jgi:hypothetical protein
VGKTVYSSLGESGLHSPPQKEVCGGSGGCVGVPIWPKAPLRLPMAKRERGVSLDLRDWPPYDLRAGTAPMAEGGFGHLRGLFVCKGPLGWTGTPERGALGPLRATSALVQGASFPPICSALKKISACKNYITKNLRRLKIGGQTCYLHLTGEGAQTPPLFGQRTGPTHWEGKPLA